MQRRKRIVAAAVAVVVAAALVFTGRAFFFPFGSDHRPVEIVIAPKMPLRVIADTLKQLKVIRSSRLLILWMRMKKTERSIQSGLVIVERGDGVIKAGKKILQARPVEISLMVPEGLTIEQTAHHISRTIAVDTARFIALCHDSAFIAQCKVPAVSLEGYLYPDTYRLHEAPSVTDIIRRMVARHQSIWSTLAPRPDIAGKYSHHQLVILASIVEREATLLSEQPHIAGVFHNRLRLGVPLGADPTVRYALKKFGGPLRVSELNSSSPYNTRRFIGLPPGPICSPGKGALAAAIWPLATKDLYFVARWDGSGGHDFSETSAQHERKKMEIRRRNERKLKARQEAADEK
ncbi:MAG: endolytic transglycosylase MltG [Chitinispirillaceae bacterium]|nr:endolytic transglycosylase MltG [Chitinispirillaceae bacterium]